MKDIEYIVEHASAETLRDIIIEQYNAVPAFLQGEVKEYITKKINKSA